MAETKKTTTKKTTTKSSAPAKTTKTTTTTHTSKSNNVWGINKISFYTIGCVAVLYLISSVLSLFGVNLKVISALQGVATAIALSIVAVLAWRYVKHKQDVWKVLYFVLLLVVLIGVILPLIV
jgi:hypothetical protein